MQLVGSANVSVGTSYPGFFLMVYFFTCFLVGVLATLFAAVRMWRASRAGAPRELVLGYMGVMVVASAISLLVLRLL